MILILFKRILNLSGKFKGRIQRVFICAVLESILSKLPIVFAFLILNGFYKKTLTGNMCFMVGIGLVSAVILQILVHFLSDRLQSGAGYMMFAEKRLELGGHLRKLPMGYFTSGNIGKISSVLSTDMIFVEEVAMSTIANMMSYVLSAILLICFLLWLHVELGIVALIVAVLATLIAENMNKLSLQEASGRQE